MRTQDTTGLKCPLCVCPFKAGELVIIIKDGDKWSRCNTIVCGNCCDIEDGQRFHNEFGRELHDPTTWFTHCPVCRENVESNYKWTCTTGIAWNKKKRNMKTG